MLKLRPEAAKLKKNKKQSTVVGMGKIIHLIQGQHL